MKTTLQVLCFVLYTSLHNMAEASILHNIGKHSADTEPNEVPLNSTHLNSSNSAPPWPTPRYDNETMFIVPREVKPGDIINITGNLNSDPKTLVAELVTGNRTPDFDNVVGQVEIEFPKKITIKYTIGGHEEIEDGLYTELIASELIKDQFNFEFVFKDKEILIRIFGKELHEINLKHSLNAIRFISLSGDIRNISQLDFQFKN